MKHLVFTIITLLFVFSTAIAQNVPEIQQSLITKITATWCPNCGGWGWTFYENIYADNANKALIITAHYSGQLQNSVGADFATNFNVNYQPYFILNNENQNVTGANVASKRIDIQNQVNDNYLTAPLANAGLVVTKDGNMLNVQTKTRFFQNAEGEFYLGVYVIEDGVINYQSGQGDNAVHKNVMRASMSNSSFGELIASGNIIADAEFEKDFSVQLGNWNVDNLEIATILWKKVGNTYEFVNTHSTTELSTVGLSVIPEEKISFTVFPTITNNKATVELDLKQEQTAVQLELFDSSGKRLATIYKGNIQTGLHTFEVDKTIVSANGLYFLVLRSENAVSTRQIIFE